MRNFDTPDSPDDGFDSALRELARVVERAVGGNGSCARFGPLWAMRSVQPTEPVHTLYTPVLCVVAQGSKQVLMGDERIVYDTGRFLVNSVALPASGQVLRASEKEPCLWVALELDPALVASVIAEAGLSRHHAGGPLRAMESSRMTRPLLDSVTRFARLFESPQDAGFLAPLVMKEIIYRLLLSEQAARLHQLAAQGGQTVRVLRAVEWVRQNFDKPLAADALARESGMSLSALYHRFKEVTAMSPLQFQKQMRLQEAKRLMISQDLDAASAGFKVGYDDPSYFSRDYHRFFGEPPRKHIARVRREVA